MLQLFSVFIINYRILNVVKILLELINFIEFWTFQ